MLHVRDWLRKGSGHLNLRKTPATYLPCIQWSCDGDRSPQRCQYLQWRVAASAEQRFQSRRAVSYDRSAVRNCIQRSHSWNHEVQSVHPENLVPAMIDGASKSRPRSTSGSGDCHFVLQWIDVWWLCVSRCVLLRIKPKLAQIIYPRWWLAQGAKSQRGLNSGSSSDLVLEPWSKQFCNTAMYVRSMVWHRTCIHEKSWSAGST